MITRSKPETIAGSDGWSGIDDRQFETQRSGGGFLKLLLFSVHYIENKHY